jgi:hypothetical protein
MLIHRKDHQSRTWSCAYGFDRWQIRAGLARRVAPIASRMMKLGFLRGLPPNRPGWFEAWRRRTRLALVADLASKHR